MRLLYITYKVDARDTLVGFVVGWLKGLAPHFDQIQVICLASDAQGTADLPPNVQVHSLGKERGIGRAGRLLRFAQTVWRLRSMVDVVFCQFSPEYLLAAAPVAKLRGWPLALWYTHRQVSLRLRLATWLADRLFTASPESFQLASPKVRVIGHGIDTERFKPGSPVTSETILAVGRRAPIKHYELLIDAARVLVQKRGLENLQVRIVGGDEGSAPPGYARELQDRIDRSGLSNVVTLVGPVPYDQVPREYQGARLHVNLCPTGGLDKAVLEGLAVGLPTLVRNETFRSILAEDAAELLVVDDRADVIAARLAGLLELPPGERQTMSERLRRRVVEQFSEAVLTERLAGQLKEISGS